MTYTPTLTIMIEEITPTFDGEDWTYNNKGDSVTMVKDVVRHMAITKDTITTRSHNHPH